jgi:hypothetical protein
VLVLVIVLVVTNLLALGAAAWLAVRPRRHPEPDPVVAAAVEAMRPPVSSSGTRRVITVEILNPIELAGTRGRLAGIAGSFAPGITRRLVYDQAIRTLRQQLVEQRVVADVRMHTITPPRPAAAVPSDRPDGGTAGRPVVDVVEADRGETAGPP